MFERYTEGARRTVFYARHQASHRNVGEITPADLVLGAALESSRAEISFAPLDGRLHELGELLSPGIDTSACPPDQNWPLSRTSKMALAYAMEEASRDKRYAIGLDHLVRGVLRTSDPCVSKLAEIGLTLKSLRIASHEMHRNVPDLRRPWAKAITSSSRRWIAIACVVLLVAAILYLRS